MKKDRETGRSPTIKITKPERRLGGRVGFSSGQVSFAKLG